ncbi:MAG: hypothetical protein HYZ51_00830 [Candidatus Doudnabacteria bacterium]|nr:hypothetical protein [Candidatus Doudnabacteria bacterium]
MIPSVYINLEDDVAKVVARIKRERASVLVLVCPKRCQLFSDSINLRLLKKQTDLLSKEVSILTMDERGQLYAKEAGFVLKFLPKSRRMSGISDIQFQQKIENAAGAHQQASSGLSRTVKEVASFVSSLVAKKPEPGPASLNEPSGVGFEQAVREAVSGGKNRVAQAKANERFKTNRFAISEKTGKGKKHKRYQTFVLSLALGLSLAVGLALIFVVLPRASVRVFPKSEPITRDYDFSLDSAAKEADLDKWILPAVKFEETLELKSKFKSLGKKDVGNKALGSVRIYNFTGQILNLKTETTSLSAGSKIYYLTGNAMQIKPTKYKNPSAKEVNEASLSEPFEIIAGAGGEDSNLPAGIRMEIANQVFGSRPQLLYAKTETPLVGGTSRFLSVVAESDITVAQNELASQILTSVQKKLSNEGSQFIENSYRIEVLEFKADKQPGTESPNFEAFLKAKVSGLAFKPKLLKDLVVQRIGQTLSENRHLKTSGDFNLSYKIRSADLNIPSAVLAVHFEGKAVANLLTEELPQKLIGKNRREASEFLQSMASIEKAEITLSPSWQSSFPWFAKKITILLEK